MSYRGSRSPKGLRGDLRKHLIDHDRALLEIQPVSGSDIAYPVYEDRKDEYISWIPPAREGTAKLLRLTRPGMVYSGRGNIDLTHGNLDHNGDVTILLLYSKGKWRDVASAHDRDTSFCIVDSDGNNRICLTPDSAAISNETSVITFYNATGTAQNYLSLDLTAFSTNLPLRVESGLIVNYSQGDDDFQVRGQTNANMLRVSADDMIGIGRAPVAGQGMLQIQNTETDTEDDVMAIIHNRAETGGFISPTIQTSVVNVDWDYNNGAGVALPVFLFHDWDHDVTVTAAGGFSSTSPRIWRLSGSFPSDISNFSVPLIDWQTFGYPTTVPGNAFYLFSFTNLASSVSGTQRALRSIITSDHDGTIIGYQGYAASSSGSTGESIGVEGGNQPVATVSRVIGVKGNPSAFGGSPPAASKVMSLLGQQGHIHLDRGSLFVRSTSTADPSAFSSTHLTHTADGQGYFEGAVEVDGVLYVDGGFNMATGASNGYVLTSDGSGTGTWQASSGGGGGGALQHLGWN